MRPLNRLSHDSARFRTTFGHEPLTHTGHSFSIDSSSMIQSPTTDLTTTDLMTTDLMTTDLTDDTDDKERP